MEILDRSPLFKGVSKEAVKALVSKLPTRSFKKNELLICQGEVADQVHLLVSGKLRVYYKSEDGGQTTIFYYQAPSLIGEMEILERLPYAGSVAAMEPSKTVMMNRLDYLSLLHSNHQVCFNLIKILSRHLYEGGGSLRVRLFGQVENILASALFSLAQLDGIPHEGGIWIARQLNKSELAQTLGIARKSVIRAFSKLQKEGLVALKGNEIFLPKLAELKRKAFLS